MASIVKLASVLGTVLLVAGCATPDRYPVSGEECGPEDPVRTMDTGATDCVPAV
ncbi:hypothetical protein [Roseovarius sp. D22-M7]|uniref:hypothetical protein n=1 Tax=Roseovarius sp. D22-M7 TaxID=3127116 RepID=UPI00300FB6E2